MKKKTIAIIFIVVVLLSIIAGVVLFLQTDRGEEENPVIEAEVVEEVTPVIEPEVEEVIEVIEPEVEEVIEVTPEPEITEVPEPEVTEAPVEEPEVTESPVEEEVVEVTPEPTPIEVVEVTPTPTEVPTPTPEPTKVPEKEPTPKPTTALKPEPTKAPTPKPTKAPTPKPTEKPEPTPEPEVIVEATEEEMVTGKYNKFNKVKSTYTFTADYVNQDWVFYADDVSTIKINKDGLKSSGSYKSYVAGTKWKDSCEHDGTFKYGETKWKYTDSTGDNWEHERVKLTKDITKFGFDFDRFEVKESKTSKDTITITGTYTLSPTANTVYDMLALEVLEGDDIVGDVNKVTANTTITIDLNTKSMKKAVLKYNMNGEIFGTASNEGELDVFITSYTHTFTFK